MFSLSYGAAIAAQLFTVGIGLTLGLIFKKQLVAYSREEVMLITQKIESIKARDEALYKQLVAEFRALLKTGKVIAPFKNTPTLNSIIQDVKAGA